VEGNGAVIHSRGILQSIGRGQQTLFGFTSLGSAQTQFKNGLQPDLICCPEELPND